MNLRGIPGAHMFHTSTSYTGGGEEFSVEGRVGWGAQVYSRLSNQRQSRRSISHMANLICCHFFSGQTERNCRCHSRCLTSCCQLHTQVNFSLACKLSFAPAENAHSGCTQCTNTHQALRSQGLWFQPNFNLPSPRAGGWRPRKGGWVGEVRDDGTSSYVRAGESLSLDLTAPLETFLGRA